MDYLQSGNLWSLEDKPKVSELCLAPELSIFKQLHGARSALLLGLEQNYGKVTDSFKIAQRLCVSSIRSFSFRANMGHRNDLHRCLYCHPSSVPEDLLASYLYRNNPREVGQSALYHL